MRRIARVAVLACIIHRAHISHASLSFELLPLQASQPSATDSAITVGQSLL